jgi:hypothetical protein
MCRAGDGAEGGAAPDAQGLPDAAPVGCQGDGDCQQPPDACSTAGTCNLATHTCSFGAIDCSSAGDDCNDGVCDVHAGGCVQRPARQGAVCGAGNLCGPFGACGGFSGTCDSTGTQSRSCTQNTCQAGACTSSQYTDTQACSRNTDGTTCGSTAVSNCGACTGSTENGCALDGHHTCTCAAMVCMSDTCQTVTTSCVLGGCSTLMPGDQCGGRQCGVNPPKFLDLCCSTDHQCSTACSTCS